MDNVLLLSASELAAAHRQNQEKSLPTRGLKLQESTGTWYESKDTHDALTQRASLLAAERVEKGSLRTLARWIKDRKVAEVTRKVGKHWQSVGVEIGGSLQLRPEEALYMLETNVLELSYNGVTMSVQQAYAMLLDETCDISAYRTYSKLRRCGYLAFRHSYIPATDDIEVLSSSTGSNKRPHEGSPQEGEPGKKKTDTAPTDTDDIEIIDLEDEEGFRANKDALSFVPNVVRKRVVDLTQAPSDLLPPGIGNGTPKIVRLDLTNLNSPRDVQRHNSVMQMTPGYYRPRQFYNEVRRCGQLSTFAARSNFMSGIYNPPQLMVREMRQMQYTRTMPNQQVTVNINMVTSRSVPFHGFQNFPGFIRGPLPGHIRANFPPWNYPNRRPPFLQSSPEQVNRERSRTPPQRPPPVSRVKGDSWAEVKALKENVVITIEEDEPPLEVDKSCLQPQDCKSLGTILEKLQIFERGAPKQPSQSLSPMILNVYHPSPSFRKSDPGTPVYRVVVASHQQDLPSQHPVLESDVPVLYAVNQQESVTYFSLSSIQLPTLD